MNSPHAMIDLETLGLVPGSQLLSIAIVPFGPTEECLHPLYLRIDISSYAQFDFEEPSLETLMWWNKQEKSVKDETFSGETSITEALITVGRYYTKVLGEDCKLWGNAASFDLKLLERAYQLCNLPVPWSYKNEMCYRTLKNLFPQVPYTKPGRAHSALEDAKAQAEHAEQILDYLAERNV